MISCLGATPQTLNTISVLLDLTYTAKQNVKGREGRGEGRARGLLCCVLPSGHFSSYGVSVIWISDISM